jgi:hypothetical protein
LFTQGTIQTIGCLTNDLQVEEHRVLYLTHLKECCVVHPGNVSVNVIKCRQNIL